MFATGDRVVCIKPIQRRYTPFKANAALPQVGCVYTIFRYFISRRDGRAMVALCELPEESYRGCRWAFDADHFRKVQNIEEPKRIVERVPELV